MRSRLRIRLSGRSTGTNVLPGDSRGDRRVAHTLRLAFIVQDLGVYDDVPLDADVPHIGHNTTEEHVPVFKRPDRLIADFNTIRDGTCIRRQVQVLVLNIL